MGKQYRIRVRGQQRERIDIDLMAHLVVLLGRKLAADAAEAIEAASGASSQPQSDAESSHPDPAS